MTDKRKKPVKDADTITKAYKFRLYPNKAQVEQIEYNFEACRFVFNHFLKLRTETYAQKRGLAFLDDRRERGLTRMRERELINAEESHFEAICDQRFDKTANDLRLLQNFVPDVYAAYWAWMESKGADDRDIMVPNFYDTSKMLTSFKKQCVGEDGNRWLDQADAIALVYALRNLDAAFQNFFRRVKLGQVPGYPRFKRYADAKRSYKTRARVINVDRERNRITLPKIGEVKCVVDCGVVGRPVSVTISRPRIGEYYASIQCADVPRPTRKRTGRDMAVETGVAQLAVTSDGDVYGKPCSYERLDRKLKYKQRQLARILRDNGGNKKSKRYLRMLAQKQRIELQIARSRRDALHQVSNQIIEAADVIYLRDNDIADMLKKKGKNREIPREVEQLMHRNLADAGLGELNRQIRYKADWHGNEVVTVEKEFPSTQMCSACGELNPKLAGIKGLSIREWACPKCGAHHDREENSAANIYEEGRRLMAEAT